MIIRNHPPARSGPHPRLSFRRRRAPDDKGQVLVEFALVIPIFLLLFMAIVEFAFVFNAILSVNFAARNAALIAAEAGNAINSDCIILASVESDVQAPADRARINQVEIYRSTLTGAVWGGSTPTTYVRSGSKTCTYPDRPPITVPYQLASGGGADGYPEIDRCNILKGCKPDTHGVTHTGVDHVGVRISYNHQYKTPIRTLFSGPSLSFDRANSMRMEPVL